MSAGFNRYCCKSFHGNHQWEDLPEKKKIKLGTCCFIDNEGKTHHRFHCNHGFILRICMLCGVYDDEWVVVNYEEDKLYYLLHEKQ